MIEGEGSIVAVKVTLSTSSSWSTTGHFFVCLPPPYAREMGWTFSLKKKKNSLKKKK